MNEIGPGSYSIHNVSGDIVRTEPQSPPDPLAEGPATSDSQIEVTWDALVDPYTGYDTITKYQILWDNGSNGVDWAVIETQQEGAFTYSYVISTGIQAGDPYQFKFRAYNQHGQGDDSPVATIYASTRPDAPPPVTTSVQGTDIFVTWQASPDEHGSAVTAYTITLLESDSLTYSSVPVHCNPASGTAAFTGKQCTIPMSVVREAPYNVPIGDVIKVRVTATNSKGESDPSEPNTIGALAQDSPTVSPSLERGSLTSAS